MADTDNKVPLPNLEDGGAPGDLVSVAPDDDAGTRTTEELEAVFDVPVQISAVLGRTRMDIGQLLSMGPAPCSNSIERSAKRSTFMSTTGWSRAVKLY